MDAPNHAIEPTPPDLIVTSVAVQPASSSKPRFRRRGSPYFREMLQRFRYVLLLSAATSLCACESSRLPLATSKNDLPTSRHGDSTKNGRRQHYVHEVSDSSGLKRDVYEYYLNDQGLAVLDGYRLICRSEADPGLAIEYRDGHEVNRSRVIVTE